MEHGIPIKRCEIALDYVFQGRSRKYHPDFEVSGVIYEVKGFWTAQSKAKSEQHPEVVVVGKQAIEFMKSQTSLRGKTYAELVALLDGAKKELVICPSCGEAFIKIHGRATYCGKKCAMIGMRKSNPKNFGVFDYVA